MVISDLITKLKTWICIYLLLMTSHSPPVHIYYIFSIHVKFNTFLPADEWSPSVLLLPRFLNKWMLGVFIWKVICAPYQHGALYLSPDENAVLYISGCSRFPKFPAGEADRVVNPVKQPFCLPVVQSNPKLICRFWWQTEENNRP